MYVCYRSVVCPVCPVCLSATLVYCSQTVGWIKMKLGMEVSLGPGHSVLNGDPALPSLKGHSPPIFGPCLLWPNGWMDQDATWNGGKPRHRPHCFRWGPSFPKKGAQPPSFRPISVVAKRMVRRQASAQATLCLMGTQLLPPLKIDTAPTLFGSCPLWPYGRMNQDASKLPLCTGDLNHHLIHGSLVPSESSTQTTSRSV